MVEQTEEGELEEDKDFLSAEAKDLWTKVLADKGFVSERGFGKLISHFSEIKEKRRWESFYAHTTLGFSTLAREFYANMVGMREDTVFVRGVSNPNHEKIIDLLTAG